MESIEPQTNRLNARHRQDLRPARHGDFAHAFQGQRMNAASLRRHRGGPNIACAGHWRYFRYWICRMEQNGKPAKRSYRKAKLSR